MKKCPFKEQVCTTDCALYIAPEDLNDTVAGRLRAIGVINKSEGICSFKNMALAQSRFIFENTEVYRK